MPLRNRWRENAKSSQSWAGDWRGFWPTPPDGGEAGGVHQGDTETLHAGIAKELEQGQDRLLQMNSRGRKWPAASWSKSRRFDQDRDLDEFMLRVFDHFGVHVEDLSDRTYLAVPANLTTDAFPELPEEGLTLTSGSEESAESRGDRLSDLGSPDRDQRGGFASGFRTGQ